MSILLTRLLRQAEAKLAAGDETEAELLSCQVLSGAATLCNTALVAEAAALLDRIPWHDEEQRGEAVLALNNKAVSMQREPVDDEAALKLCDALIPLTRYYPHMHTAVHNMAVFIATRISREKRQHYVEKLLGLLDGMPVSSDEAAQQIETTPARGASHAAAVLASRGAVLIRGVLERAPFGAVRTAAEQYFGTHDEQAIIVHNVFDVSPLLAGEGAKFLVEVMRPFFPVPPVLQLRQTFLRHVALRYPETAVPFHQDVQAFGRLLINCWTPLTPCGSDAPGLELVPSRLREVTATVPADDQYDDVQISEELVRERFGEDAIYRPEMEPGDVLVLLGTTIHRTFIRPEMKNERLSVELRFGLE